MSHFFKNNFCSIDKDAFSVCESVGVVKLLALHKAYSDEHLTKYFFLDLKYNIINYLRQISHAQ